MLPLHLFLPPLVSMFFSFDAECVVTLSMMMFSSAMSYSQYGNVVPRNRQFSKLSSINFFIVKIFFVSNIPKPSFELIRLVNEVCEEVIELLHIFCTITSSLMLLISATPSFGLTCFSDDIA